MKGFGTFLAKPEKNIVLVTYRDNFQKRASDEYGKFSDRYRELSAVIYLDDSEFVAIDAADGMPVKVINSDTGASVVVTARRSETGHKGLGLMPNSPWSNRLIAVDDGGMPGFKRTQVKIKVGDGEKVSVLAELL